MALLYTRRQLFAGIVTYIQIEIRVQDAICGAVSDLIVMTREIGSQLSLEQWEACAIRVRDEGGVRQLKMFCDTARRYLSNIEDIHRVLVQTGCSNIA